MYLRHLILWGIKGDNSGSNAAIKAIRDLSDKNEDYVIRDQTKAKSWVPQLDQVNEIASCPPILVSPLPG